MRWTPRWVAEAVSVPLAAQVACTPVVAALSGQVSLVAVAANLLLILLTEAIRTRAWRGEKFNPIRAARM
jgi:hypothetical protein